MNTLNIPKDLMPVYDYAKSFYGKARTHYYKSQELLISYETVVASRNLETNVITLLNTDEYTNTTCRHVREFMQQNGYPKLTKKQLLDQKIFGEDE